MPSGKVVHSGRVRGRQAFGKRRRLDYSKEAWTLRTAKGAALKLLSLGVIIWGSVALLGRRKSRAFGSLHKRGELRQENQGTPSIFERSAVDPKEATENSKEVCNTGLSGETS